MTNTVYVVAAKRTAIGSFGGHPVSTTGAIITAKLICEMRCISVRYGLATMCIGGGQGIAAIFERV